MLMKSFFQLRSSTLPFTLHPQPPREPSPTLHPRLPWHRSEEGGESGRTSVQLTSRATVGRQKASAWMVAGSARRQVQWTVKMDDLFCRTRGWQVSNKLNSSLPHLSVATPNVQISNLERKLRRCSVRHCFYWRWRNRAVILRENKRRSREVRVVVRTREEKRIEVS